MFEIFKDETGWKWRMMIRDKLVAVSVESYSRRTGCMNEIERIKAQAPGMGIIMRLGDK